MHCFLFKLPHKMTKWSNEMVELCYFVCRMKWLLSDHESLEMIQPLFINMYLSIVVSRNHGNAFQVHESNRLSRWYHFKLKKELNIVSGDCNKLDITHFCYFKIALTISSILYIFCSHTKSHSRLISCEQKKYPTIVLFDFSYS